MRDGDFTTFGEFEDLVDQRLSDLESEGASMKLVGMLFMREGQALTDKEIIPSLDYLHGRSVDHIDFYLAGWKYYARSEGVASSSWTFNLETFLRAQDAIESETDWSYSGGVDLLLMTASKRIESDTHSTYHSHKRVRYMVDLTGVISIPVHSLVKANLIESPDILFERIIRFAKVFEGADPLLGLSGQEARVSIVEGLTNTVLGLLPKEAKERVDYAKHFAIKDVSKKGRRKSAIVKVDTESNSYP
jgi:hypothetical protein